MKAIAKEAAMSPALLQYYFPSREDLLLAVITQWDDDNEHRRPGEPMFIRWIDSIRHNASVPGLMHLYTVTLVEAIDENHPAKEYFAKRYADSTDRLIANILLQQYQGCLPSTIDPKRLARLLLAVSEGLQIRWLHDPSFDMADEFAYLLDLFGICHD